MAGIFKKNDIRGIWNETLTPKIGFLTGYYFASKLGDKPAITIGGDSRLSTPELINAISAGMKYAGATVYNLGLGPTPMIYFSCSANEGIVGGIIVTASHNPKEYNGIKICDSIGAAYHYDNLYVDIEEFVDRFVKNEAYMTDLSEKIGQVLEGQYLKKEYYKYLIDNFDIKNSLRILIEFGNGAAGAFEDILLELGCDVTSIRRNPDGNFPTLLPDPSKLISYDKIKEKLKENSEYDICLAFDGDGDRIGFMTSKGDLISPDKIIMLYANDILEEFSDAQIIIDVKVSKATQELIKDAGGRPIISQVGHSWVHEKIIELDAEFAGELSGHYYFNDNYYGFDDALYSALRFLKIIDGFKSQNKQLEDVILALPEYSSTREFREHIPYEIQDKILIELSNYIKSENGELITIDGVRGEFDNGWFIARKSGTEELLSYRVEGITDNDKNIILNKVKSIIDLITDK
jgi:phosphomannomutase/phosphoglucomutase